MVTMFYDLSELSNFNEIYTENIDFHWKNFGDGQSKKKIILSRNAILRHHTDSVEMFSAIEKCSESEMSNRRSRKKSRSRPHHHTHDCIDR